ncbi:MAG: YdeI/OmpD-associated family protein [Chitinophagaceae bacterium]|nr:YdeI/OmpD-associated family protein [Chitinophagaceae bacterium]
MEVLAPSLSVFEKLQLKDEKNLLIQGLPSTIEKQFAKLSFSKNVTPLLKIKRIDFALVFAISHNQLKDILKDVVPALAEDAKLWIAYPKVSSKIVSDLSRDCNWQCITAYGIEAVRSIALDNVWCGIRFKKAEKIKRSSAIAEMDCIDLENRTITTPVELQSLFTKNKKANAFFETLSFTNKKEYIVWINSAKKEETKTARLEATIEKLSTGKRNPSDK